MLNFGKKILTQKINRLGLFLTLILSAWLIYFLFGYFNPVRVTRLYELDTAKLPAPWPTVFANSYSMPLWLYVKISNKELEYYAHASIKRRGRVNVVVNTIKEILELKKYKIPDGIYVFNLGDITRIDYPFPILAFTAPKQLVDNQKVVLIPDNRALKGHANRFAALDAVMPQYPWEKRKNKIFWRGKATGGNLNDTEITQVLRLRFIQLTRNLDYIDAGITDYPASLNAKLRLEAELKFGKVKFEPLETALGYKYLMDIDGHSCSFDRMAWILYSDSVLFKHQSDQVQWYYDKLLPWVHYIPVAADFSDLSQRYNWIEAHPVFAKDMKDNSRKFAQATFNHTAVLRSLAIGMSEYQELVQNVQSQQIS